MKQLILSISFILFMIVNACSQNYFEGKFKIRTTSHRGYTYRIYDFSRENTVMKAKYFANNAYSQYLQWKGNKDILLVTAGAFSDRWDADAIPVGLCVDNGRIVNRTLNSTWDGMTIIYNGGSQIGGIAVVDLSQKPVSVLTSYPDGQRVTYNIKEYASDRSNFLSWGESNNVTLFQTMLVYSSDKSTNFNNLYYGNKRERRFLAICRKEGFVHHVIVDAPEPLELNLSASYAKTVLENDGFSVSYILNLDTGDKNIFYNYNGSFLEDMKPYKGSSPERATIENATNLLVYYKD